MSAVRRRQVALRVRLALLDTTAMDLLLLAFAIVGFVLFGTFAFSLFACAPEPSQAETAAAKLYGDELRACVDDAGTRAESRACREGVDCRWGQGPCKDGGKP